MHRFKHKWAYEASSYARNNDLAGFDLAWQATPFDVREKLNTAELVQHLNRYRQGYEWGFYRGSHQAKSDVDEGDW